MAGVRCDMVSADVHHILQDQLGSRRVAVVLVGLAEAAACIAMSHLTWTWLYRKAEQLRWSLSDCDPEEGLRRRCWRKQHLVVRSKRFQSSAAVHDCIRDPAEPDIEPSRFLAEGSPRFARHPSSSRVAALTDLCSQSGTWSISFPKI
jgi:hypothetical protein